MIILITGAPGVGKSTIASNLAKMINAIIIPQDSFYTIPFDNFPYDKGMDVEGENLIYWDDLCSTVKRVDMAKDVDIVVEGHLVACNPRLLRYADVIVDIYSPYPLVKKRFMNRYSDNYSISQLDIKEQYFEEKTWPAYERYFDKFLVPLKEMDKAITIKPTIEDGTAEILSFIKRN